jgi:pimeloyl-ACP methyl ester carboxylesterase
MFTENLKPLRDGRDIIIVEQRGTRYSEPFLACDENLDFSFVLLNQDLSDEEILERTREDVAICHDGFVEEGINLSAYNSLQNAADIPMVVHALGYQEYSIYGGSYGTILAQHVMRDYPDNIQSVILDSGVPLGGDLIVQKPRTINRAFRLLFESCANDSACDTAYPDLDQVFFGSVDQFNAEPPSLDITDTATGEVYEMQFTGDRYISLMTLLLYETSVIPVLPQAINDVASGDYSFISLVQSQIINSLGRNLSTGMSWTVSCSEFDLTADPELDNLYPQFVDYFSTQAIVDDVVCEIWNVSPLDQEANSPFTTDIPVLIMAGDLDPVAPPEYSVLIAEYLDHAFLYTFPGVGHGTIAAGACPVSIMADFLDNPSEQPDTTCLEAMGAVTYSVADDKIVELEPFTLDDLGIRGLRPVNWEPVHDRMFARLSSNVDQTVLIFDLQPMNVNRFFQLVSEDLNANLEFMYLDTRDGWRYYDGDAQGYPVFAAFSEHGNHTGLVLLICENRDAERLYADVFLPVVAAYEIIAEDD